MTIRSAQSQRQEEEIARHHLLPELSPFQAGRTHPPATLVEIFSGAHHAAGLAAVISTSNEVDAEGAPVRSTIHLVGRLCRHWAPEGRTTGDCRFGCIGRAKALVSA